MGGNVCRVNSVFAFVVVALSVGLPVLQLLLSERTWADLDGAWATNQSGIRYSVSIAAAAASLVVLVGGMTWNRRVVGVSWFAFFIPGALLSVVLIPIFNRPGVDWIYRGLGIVLLALGLRYLAVGWSGLRAVLGSLDRAGLEFAAMSGASRWERFRHGVWPQAGAGLLTIWYAAFLFCLWDVDAVLLVAPPGMQTLPMQVFNLLHYGHNSQVNALCLILLGLALTPLVLWAAGKALTARFSATRLAMAASACALATAGIGCGGGPANALSETDVDVVSLESRFFESVKLLGVRGTGPGQFNKPRSLAVDGKDNLYVVDMTRRVQKFSSSGDYILQ